MCVWAVCGCVLAECPADGDKLSVPAKAGAHQANTIASAHQIEQPRNLLGRIVLLMAQLSSFARSGTRKISMLVATAPRGNVPGVGDRGALLPRHCALHRWQRVSGKLQRRSPTLPVPPTVAPH